MRTNKFLFEAANCFCIFWIFSLSWYIECWFADFVLLLKLQTNKLFVTS